MHKHIIAIAIAALLALIAPEIASAHANLIQSNIKNNEVFHVGHTPSKITGKFAEDLAKGSWMAVFEGQADHGLVTENQKSKINFKHPDEMTLALPKKLGKEKYYLIWYTHSAVDGHWAAGIVYFQVK